MQHSPAGVKGHPKDPQILRVIDGDDRTEDLFGKVPMKSLEDLSIKRNDWCFVLHMTTNYFDGANGSETFIARRNGNAVELVCVSAGHATCTREVCRVHH